jgi:integrase
VSLAISDPPSDGNRASAYGCPQSAANDASYVGCGHRDATLILIAFRHGLRAAEICDFEWSQVQFGRRASYEALLH